MYRAAIFIVLCLLILSVGCSGDVSSPANTTTPGYAITYIQTATPRKTIQWISTPTTILPIQVSPGIGEGVTITTQEIDLQYNNISLPAGLAVTYTTLEIINNNDLDYDLWVKSPVDNQPYQLLSCNKCPLQLYSLKSVYTESGELIIIARDVHGDGSEKALMINLNEQRTEMVECQPYQTVQCNIIVTGHYTIILFGFYPTEKIVFRTMEGNWITISGEVLGNDAWDFILLEEGILFYPKYCSSQSSLFLSFSSLEVEERPSILCLFDEHPLPYFLGWSSDSGNIAYAWTSEDDSGEKYFDKITICPLETLLTGEISACFGAITNLISKLPFRYSLGWLDDGRFIWDKPGGILESQIIGTIDLDGNVKTIYQGEGITYEVSPDGKWLLYRRTEAPLSFGLLSTDDGSTIYLPLPENTVDATWLLIP